jgi:hypothetical protein
MSTSRRGPQAARKELMWSWTSSFDREVVGEPFDRKSGDGSDAMRWICLFLRAEDFHLHRYIIYHLPSSTLSLLSLYSSHNFNCEMHLSSALLGRQIARCVPNAAAVRLLSRTLPRSLTHLTTFRWYQPASSSLSLQWIQPQPFIYSFRLLSVQSNESRSRNRGVRLPLDDCRNIDDVLKLVVDNIDNLPPNQVAAAWSFMPRLLSKEQRNGLDLRRTRIDDAKELEHREQQLQLFFQHTMSAIDKLRYRDLTTIVLSMAKSVKIIREAHERRKVNIYHQTLGSILQDSNPFGHFAKAADRILVKFSARHMSNLAYAYALVGYDPKLLDGSSLLRKIGDKSITCIKQFNSQDISNLVWACAKTDVQHAALFEAVGNHVVRLDDLATFKPQAIANIVWAYATLNEKHPALFEKVGNHMVRLGDLTAFKPQALANISWAYATLNVQHAALFEEVGGHIVRLDDLVAFNSQELSNIIWAYATLDERHQALFKKVGDFIIRLDDLSAFNTQNLANIVWAYAKLNERHIAMFGAVGNHIVRLDELASFNPQDFANIVWAFAKVNAKHPALFKQIGDSIVCFGSSKQFIPQNLANIVWAYGKVGVQHPDLFKMIGHSIAAVNDLAIFDTRHLTNISWAYAMADINAPWLFNDRFTNELLRRQHQFNVAELRQLYQWHVWGTKDQSNTGLPSPLKEKCTNAYNGSQRGG